MSYPHDNGKTSDQLNRPFYYWQLCVYPGWTWKKHFAVILLVMNWWWSCKSCCWWMKD